MQYQWGMCYLIPPRWLLSPFDQNESLYQHCMFACCQRRFSVFRQPAAVSQPSYYLNLLKLVTLMVHIVTLVGHIVTLIVHIVMLMGHIVTLMVHIVTLMVHIVTLMVHIVTIMVHIVTLKQYLL